MIFSLIKNGTNIKLDTYCSIFHKKDINAFKKPTKIGANIINTYACLWNKNISSVRREFLANMFKQFSIDFNVHQLAYTVIFMTIFTVLCIMCPSESVWYVQNIDIQTRADTIPFVDFMLRIFCSCESYRIFERNVITQILIK